MTAIQSFKVNKKEFYRVWENGKVKYCTLDEVMYILSTKEKK